MTVTWKLLFSGGHWLLVGVGDKNLVGRGESTERIFLEGRGGTSRFLAGWGDSPRIPTVGKTLHSTQNLLESQC